MIDAAVALLIFGCTGLAVRFCLFLFLREIPLLLLFGFFVVVVGAASAPSVVSVVSSASASALASVVSIVSLVSIEAAADDDDACLYYSMDYCGIGCLVDIDCCAGGIGRLVGTHLAFVYSLST